MHGISSEQDCGEVLRGVALLPAFRPHTRGFVTFTAGIQLAPYMQVSGVLHLLLHDSRLEKDFT